MKNVIRKCIYVIVFLFASYLAYFAWSYQSVTNVFLEMNQATLYYEDDLLGLPNVSNVLQSERFYKSTYNIIRLPLQTDLPQDEEIAVIVGQYQTFGLEFRKEVEDNIFLYITFTYKDGKLVEEVEAANSDISLSNALQTYRIDKKSGGEKNREENLKTTYWFSSSKGLPSLQITDTKEVLEYLKPYGIDEQWIQEKADYMLYDVVLKRWFEKGSQRYSFDNLGNVTVVPLDFAE